MSPIPNNIWKLLGILDFPKTQVNIPVDITFPSPRVPLPKRQGHQYYRIIVMVKQIVDTRVFIGVWRGNIIKCVAYPDTGGLVVGTYVIVTRVERSTEYFYRETVGLELLYFTPGYDYDGGSTQGELWKYDGVADPTYVWSCPNADEQITALFWTNLTNMLYICTFCSAGDDRSRIYKCDVSTDPETVTLCVNAYTYPAKTNSDAATDAAEFGDGLIYITHGGVTQDNQFISRFDPILETITHLVAAAGGWGTGGVTVHKGNGWLYATPGSGGLYRSANGNVSTWAIVDPLTDYSYCGNLVTYRGDDLAYFTATYRPGAGTKYTRILRINTDNTISVEHQETMADDTDNSYYLMVMGILYTLGVASQLLATPYSGGAGIALPVYAETGGVWGIDASLADEYASNPNQSLICANEMMHMLVHGSNKTRLLQQSAPGTWNTIYTWDGYAPSVSHLGILAMTPVETCVFAHEM